MMETKWMIAAALLVAIGAAHSYLGERYILVRLFRRENLPRLYGGDEFTKRTLRFAWHLTTVTWWGLAAALVALARDPADSAGVVRIVAVTFLVSAAITVVASKGKHFAWAVFLAIGLLAW